MEEIKFAIIAPVGLLDYSSIGKIHMTIAPIALQSEEYASYFRNEKANYNKYIILDNGAFELDKPLGLPDLLTAQWLTKADELVIPDIIGDSQASLELLKEFLSKFKRPEGLKLQAVVQGNNLKELEEHYLYLLECSEVDTIGISHSFQFTHECGKTNSRMWSRVMFVDYLRRQCWLKKHPKRTKPIHLMGMTNPIELYYQSINNISAPFIRSNDSSAPIIYGINNITFNRYGIIQEKIATKLDFYWRPTFEIIQDIDLPILMNIETLFNYTKGVRYE